MTRPVVAIISNALTPYRLHFHRRLVAELAHIEWWSLFTHDISNAPWPATDEAEIRPVRFGPGERADDQSKMTNAMHEFRKGGRITKWLASHHVAAVILLGYNDLGRLRIIRWCRRHKTPCLLFGDSNIRGDTNDRFKSSVKQVILRRILRSVSGVLTCGTLGREYFRKYGVPEDRMFEVPYEPDYTLIKSQTPEVVQTVYAKYGLRIDRQYVLYCGRLAGVKRVDLLVDAFAAIASQRPDWDLLLVGDGPLRAELQQRIAPLLRDRVRFVGFVGDQSTIAAFQRRAQVLVLPSDFEPWAVVINEAVAADMAVVSSDAVGAAADLVRDRINGRIFPRGDLTALIEALIDVTGPNLNAYRSAAASVLADCA